jgi:methionyl-tRNA formyltransferase
MRILFAGTPQVAVPFLQALVQSDNDVVAVLTRKDAVRGRGRKLTPSPVKQAAEKLGIPVFDCAPSDPDFIQWISGHVDAAVVVAYGRILRQNVLDAVRLGWYNVHFSLLPSWRGAAPVQRTIWNGDTKTGITIFQLDAGMDTGRVLLEHEEQIDGEPTSGELMDHLAHVGAPLLVSSLAQVQKAAFHTDDISKLPADEDPDLDAVQALMHDQSPLDDQSRARARKISAEDARADFTLPAAVAGAHIRACNPDPGAWTTLKNGTETIKLHLNAVHTVDSQATDDVLSGLENQEVSMTPGSVIVTKKHVYVMCGDRQVLEIVNVTAPGKKPMRAADWARGARLHEGAHCE